MAVDIFFIQQGIGYSFKNKRLLMQAFTRKSYTAENKDMLDNEVLEFYGDKALDLVVMKRLREQYGRINDDGFFESVFSEGELSKLKEKLVCQRMLAERIRILGYHHFLMLGTIDVLQQAKELDSVQEDLFEAIVGAVAIDSNWDVAILSDVVNLMLDLDYYLEHGFDDEKDYVQLIQQWYQKKYRALPIYTFGKGCRNFHLFQENYDGSEYQCDLAIAPFNYFQALGKTKNSARMAAAKKAYQYLEKNQLLLSLVDEVGVPSIERAVNQLQELHQKGYIAIPQYEFREYHDENGNPVWHCMCHVDGFDMLMGDFSPSKKEAKKLAAFKMVELFLKWEENHET